VSRIVEKLGSGEEHRKSSWKGEENGEEAGEAGGLGNHDHGPTNSGVRKWAFF
jgi:hypothetical protein